MYRTRLLPSAILIVDSDTDWWNRNMALLPAELIAVRVEDIDSAVEELSHRPIDLVVMELLVDESLVYGDAPEAIQHIREVWGKPVVLFTAAWEKGDQFDREKVAAGLGVSAVVLKRPRGPEDDLPACIRRLLPSRASARNAAA